MVIIAPVAAADDNQLSPLAAFDNVQFAGDFNKVFHLGADFAVREANSNQVSLRSTKTRGVDVPKAVMEFSYEHVPGTNDLSNAYFTSVAVRQNSLLLKQALLSFAEGNSPRGIPKNRLRELVYEDLGGEFSHGKIRAEMEHLIEVSGELDIIEGRQGAKLVVIGRGNGGNDDH